MANKKTPEQILEENGKLQEQLAEANKKLEQAEADKVEADKVLAETKEQLAEANKKLESLEVGANEIKTLVDAQKEKINQLEKTIAEKGKDLAISSVAASSTILTKPTEIGNVNVGLTKVKISYPAEYKEEKHFKEGEEKFVSKESAEHFVKLGIASILE